MLAPTYMGWTTSGAAFWPRLDPRRAHVLRPFTCDAALGPASQTPRVAGPLMDVSAPLEPCTYGTYGIYLHHRVLEMLMAVDMAGETTST
jgi:hypothetical protein